MKTQVMHDVETAYITKAGKGVCELFIRQYEASHLEKPSK